MPTVKPTSTPLAPLDGEQSQQRNNSFVMGPHAQHLDRRLFTQHLVDQPVLQGETAGVCAGQIADQFFVGWRGLKRIFAQQGQ